MANDQIRPAQTQDINGLAQVIVSTTAVPNGRTLGPDWHQIGERFTKFNVSDFNDLWVESTFATDAGQTLVTRFAAGAPLV